MGRFSASGARLHELRQPKPTNAALHQSRPPRSHGSSLAPKHPQSAIRPACQEGPALDVDVIEPPSVPPAQRWLDPPRRPRGSAPRLLPLGPHRPHARSSAAGLLPGTRRCAPRPGHIGWQAEQGDLASAANRGNPGKSPQRYEAPRRLCRGSRTHAGRSRRACRTPATALVQKAPKTALGRAAAPTQVHRAQCGTGEAPQERRRGCTRTPRRRHRSGWTGP